MTSGQDKGTGMSMGYRSAQLLVQVYDSLKVDILRALLLGPAGATSYPSVS